MTTSQSIYFLIFGCLLYLIFTDENVAKLVGYLGRLIQFQYNKAKWLLLHLPSNPIVKYIIYRRSLKTAEKILKSIRDKE